MVRDILLARSETTVPPKTSFTGGVQILLSKTSNCMINNCTFRNITTPKVADFDPSTQPDVDKNWLGFGLGGGLSIIISSEHSSLSIEESSFEDNTASWGAGAYIKFSQESINCSATITNSQFSDCWSRVTGGLYISFSKQTQITNINQISVYSCKFIRNTAAYGAGTHIQAFFGNFLQEANVNFINCSWQVNTARYSPAVDISPSMFDILATGLLPVVMFRDCKFIGNCAAPKHDKNSTFINSGVFVISRFKVLFAGSIKFQYNSGTALLINSGRAVFRANSQIEFTNNTGLYGGAIALHGYTSLLVNNNSYFTFNQNNADVAGGAIYHFPIDQKEFFEGRACFISYNGTLRTPVTKRNITFEFISNTAPSGSSIYASSFIPCYYAYNGERHHRKIQEFFTKIGNFSFDGVYNMTAIESRALATSGHTIKWLKESFRASVIPGKQFCLPLAVYDELENTVSGDMFVSATGNATLKSHYTNNNSITLYGSPNDIASVLVATKNRFRVIHQSTEQITLLQCPPGFYLNGHYCACSSSNASQAFSGIPHCNQQNFTAYLGQGYWIGCYDKKVYTSPCYFWFCKGNRGYLELPSSNNDLSEFICQPTRKGILCSECVQNYSTYYHSRKFTCGKDYCSYGIIFYLLSELVPVVVFFTITVIFDVSFSSGGKNGFIFYSQIINIMPLDWSTANVSQGYRIFQIGYNLFYGVFNFEFFSVEQLSFCLFEGATVMDVLAFKYISAVFAFGLVVVLATCLNHCSCCDKLCKVMKTKVTRKVSVIHGLSACLVICYTTCARVSVRILRTITLKGAGGSVGPMVTSFGGLHYLGTEHIRYAIPAIFALLTIGFIPPFLLLLYPSALNLLKLCNLNEHRLVLCILRYSQIQKLMPMFDVFQGCFKDNLRFFAGLYFMYRTLILLPYLVNYSLSGYVILLEIAIALIFSIHSIAQPYKERKHNVIDSLLLGNLVIINGISSLVRYQIHTRKEDIHISILLYLQLILIYMPIIVLIALLVLKLVGKKVQCKKNTRKEDDYGLMESFDENRGE